MNTIELTNPNQAKPVSNGVLGMVFLVITEIMFFAGLISAYLVNRAGMPIWPPHDQPRLPVEITAVNTVILGLSGVFFIFLTLGYAKKSKNYMIWLILSIAAGLTFFGIQGYEWIKLLGFGLTTTSSIYGAFFYSIIGMHGIHVLLGIVFLLYLLVTLIRTKSHEKGLRTINAISIFWYFVILIWPILYYLVYLY
jgi:heme/copper-type cytochrome/quinol oxidase subunit 3